MVECNFAGHAFSNMRVTRKFLRCDDHSRVISEE